MSPYKQALGLGPVEAQLDSISNPDVLEACTPTMEESYGRSRLLKRKPTERVWPRSVVLLMWLYLSAYIVLMGAELNSEMEHQTARDTTRGEELPMGQRGGKPEVGKLDGKA